MSVPVQSALSTAVTSIDVPLLVTLFDQASDVAFFVKNALGQYIAVNDSLLNRHGLKQKADALGKRPYEICPGEFGRVPFRPRRQSVANTRATRQPSGDAMASTVSTRLVLDN